MNNVNTLYKSLVDRAGALAVADLRIVVHILHEEHIAAASTTMTRVLGDRLSDLLSNVTFRQARGKIFFNLLCGAMFYHLSQEDVLKIEKLDEGFCIEFACEVLSFSAKSPNAPTAQELRQILVDHLL